VSSYANKFAYLVERDHIVFYGEVELIASMTRKLLQMTCIL